MSEINEDIERLQNKIDNIVKKIHKEIYLQGKYDTFKAIDKFELEKDIKNMSKCFLLFCVIFQMTGR